MSKVNSKMAHNCALSSSSNCCLSFSPKPKYFTAADLWPELYCSCSRLHCVGTLLRLCNLMQSDTAAVQRILLIQSYHSSAFAKFKRNCTAYEFRNYLHEPTFVAVSEEKSVFDCIRLYKCT